ncbi:dual specificity protein kinase TTK [Lepeophtheirus salmonis]|uniref:Dual specificity protein kinase Ttklike [Oryzias latipes] n=1 Tax=Lepeophtheirus salmonis TaxID=72036 RepID=A0A0K2UTV4_LEPSM|nr:dual specificity protein kinase TTK-like [Lepeophtheirus salmonis]
MYATPITKDARLSDQTSELSLTSSSRMRPSRLGKLRNLGAPQRHARNWNENGTESSTEAPLRRMGSAHLFSAKNLCQINEDDTNQEDPSRSPHISGSSKSCTTTSQPISQPKCEIMTQDENHEHIPPFRHSKENKVKEKESTDSIFLDIKSPHKLLTVNNKMYKPLKVLGKGGSSQVLEVIDTQGSLRAVKVVDMCGNDDEIKNSFLNEIKVLEKLQCYNRVIKMYDYQYCKQEAKLYVVMEKGETDLGSILRNELSDTKIKFYWEEMLNVVKIIHEAGIIHSDLKPANFLLVSGMLKIIDFGISTSIQSDHTSVITNSLGGTCNFMSPEAIQGIDSDVGSPKVKISFKSDVWSLGCILYLMAYGKTPFYDIKAQYKKCQAIVDPNHKIPFPEHSKDGRLVGIISSCLNRDPQQRPTVDELLSHDYLKIGSCFIHLSAIEEMCSPDTRRGILRAKNKISQSNLNI